MDSKQKILFCGDVEGKFNALFKRVNKIMKSSGDFDMLLCVGNFFGINNSEFVAYKSGEKKVPLSVYVLGPNKEEHVSLYPDNDGEICPNVFYLGKRGIFTTAKGLKIAYVSGIADKTSSEFTYNNKDISELFDARVKGNSTFRGVDVFLSSQWPNQVVDSALGSKIIPKNASDLPCWLIMKLKPRYAISGLEGIHYERPPFRVPSLGDHDSTVEIATRFIGLARVDNPNKDKWIYALNVMPLEKMKVSELMQKTTDETACPFDFDELQSSVFQIAKKGFGAKQYFYSTDTVEDEPSAKKKKKGKIVFDQSKCWFCLASPSVEKHLIVTVGEHSYLALAKGGVTEEHFLICPIEHYQSSLNQPDEVRNEIDKFKQAIRKFYNRKNEVPIFFERNYKTSHMQLQSIPIPDRATRELKEIFKDEADANGLTLNELDPNDRIEQALQIGVPFFLAELPDNTVLYTHIKSSHFPLNFARDVVCTGPVLNLPERTEWRDCALSKDRETELVARIRTNFEPYDFNQ